MNNPNHPLVINIRWGNKPPYIYIGRKKPLRHEIMHYGNPFSHLDGTLADVIVGSREDAVQAYADWLDGTAWPSIEPERRQWILEHIEDLRDKFLGCYCAPELCHGTVLAMKANGED